MEKTEFKRHRETRDLLKKVAGRYGLKKLLDIVENDNSLLFEKDVYICLHNIVDAAISGAKFSKICVMQKIFITLRFLP